MTDPYRLESFKSIDRYEMGIAGMVADKVFSLTKGVAAASLGASPMH